MYSQHTTFYPALGKERELLKHLEQWAKDLQAQGVSVAVMHQLFNPDGPTFVSAVHYRDLAEFENRRHQWQTDSRFQAGLDKVLSLSRAAPTAKLFEVPVPFPS